MKQIKLKQPLVIAPHVTLAAGRLLHVRSTESTGWNVTLTEDEDEPPFHIFKVCAEEVVTPPLPA